MYIGVKVIFHAEFPKEYRPPAILIGSVGALFFLGFFSLHFCGLHAVHAIFLSSFFPIEGLSSHTFANAFTNPVLLWKIVFKHLLMVYGGFLVPAIIAERRYVFASIIDAVKAVREGVQNDIAQDFGQSGAPAVALLLAQRLNSQRQSMRDPFFRPYINVIRMHIRRMPEDLAFWCCRRIVMANRSTWSGAFPETVHRRQYWSRLTARIQSGGQRVL